MEVLLTAVPWGERFILHTVWRDIADRKRLEAQLLQSRKMAAIGTLAGGIAHDFNNLLVAINVNADLLEKALADQSELQELAAQLRQAGVEAFTRFKKNCKEVDLLITDVVMPKLCGPDLVRLLHHEGFDPIVLFASGYMDSEFEDVRAMGEEHNLILKPFSPEAMLRRVREALDS